MSECGAERPIPRAAAERLCFSSRVDNRGGSQVNRRYAEKLRPFAACLAGRSMVECPQ